MAPALRMTRSIKEKLPIFFFFFSFLFFFFLFLLSSFFSPSFFPNLSSFYLNLEAVFEYFPFSQILPFLGSLELRGFAEKQIAERRNFGSLIFLQ